MQEKVLKRILLNSTHKNYKIVKKLGKLQTFLLEHAVVAALILVGLYWLFSEAAEFVADLVFGSSSYFVFKGIEFVFVFVSLAILLLVLVPLGLYLPNGKESLKDYAKSIRLNQISPWKRNVLLGAGFAAIFCMFTLIFGLLSGEYIFDLNVIFGWSESDNPGVFGFISMLNPGIWEEVAFRGIILTLLFKKYSRKKAIIIDGVIFGSAHLFNILSGANIMDTVIQMLYATCLGFSFAYMYIRTESLIPGILAHYLIDAVNPLFLNVILENTLLVLIYMIIFVLILPNVVIIRLVKTVMDREIKLQ